MKASIKGIVSRFLVDKETSLTGFWTQTMAGQISQGGLVIRYHTTTTTYFNVELKRLVHKLISRWIEN